MLFLMVAADPICSRFFEVKNKKSKYLRKIMELKASGCMCWLFKSRGRGSLHGLAAVFLSLSVRLLALSTEGTGRG